MKRHLRRLAAILLCLTMLLPAAAFAQTDTAPLSDPSPAIYVARHTASSVVGVITLEQYWIREYDRIQETTVAMGSGVVIREGGYILTNRHVIEGGSVYRILLPSGEKADAELVAADEPTDIALLKLKDADAAAQLVPVSIGSCAELAIGSTVIAIGNPGGEVLANTVTQGVVSALERSALPSGDILGSLSYIQHDAAINDGSSGGGLFNYKGELVGINTMKYSRSAYSDVAFEGLGFAIPAESANAIVEELLTYGKVRRAAIGAGYSEYTDGPAEPVRNAAPAGLYVTDIPADSPAEAAGFKLYDCIYSVNGVRIKSYSDLFIQLDQFAEGDVVEVEVVRYAEIEPSAMSSLYSMYDFYFGGGARTMLSVNGGYETITLSVTLRYE